MKRLLFITLLLFSITTVKSQSWENVADFAGVWPRTVHYVRNWSVDSVIWITSGRKSFRIYTDTFSLAKHALMEQPMTYKLLWIKPNGDLSAFTPTYLLPADTLNKWQVRGIYLVPGDTSWLHNQVVTKLYIQDTASMLSSYLRKADTIWLSQRISQKLNASDTTNKWQAKGTYLIPPDTVYLHNSLASKLNSVDTLNKWQPKGIYLTPADTSYLHNTLVQKLNITDTANKWQPKGTYLVPADTVNRWQPKGSYLTVETDPLSVHTGDSTAMLAPYLRKGDTVFLSTRINGKVAYTDTAVMLLPYLRRLDTLSLSTRINTKLSITDTTNKWQVKGNYAIANGLFSQYIAGDGSKVTFPTIPTLKNQETFSGTTDASGNLTVTFTKTYSTIPDIQPQLIAGTPSQTIRITSRSTTGCTINVTNRASVTIATVEVLLAATTPVSAAGVSILVTER